jgi:pheromone shutdown protein TraB
MGDSEIDHEGIDALMHSDEMERLMAELAEQVATSARILAPKRTGRMASRIKSRTENSAVGVIGRVLAPAPANLLSTARGIRHQVTAYGHRVNLWHPADRPFLRQALIVVKGIWD